jgi:hypothetical protein
MLFAVLLPVLVGQFLLVVERPAARVCEPPDHDAGGPGPQGPANDDGTRATSDRSARHDGNEADIEGRGPWTNR